MGAALFIALERDIPGFDPFVSGKALSASENALDGLARTLGITPLMEFFSTDGSEVADLLDEAPEFDEPLADAPDETWFPALDGLTTVRALQRHLRDHPDAVDDVESVLEDLDAFERVLDRAATDNVGWHLSVDF